MAVRLNLRHDTTANWTSSNPVLAQGEIGVDTTLRRAKVGDGTTAWNSLAFGLGVDTDLQAFVDAAQTAQGLSEDARDLAQEWAENPEDDEITGSPGSYSSLHHSAKAEGYAAAAEAAKDDAETARDSSFVNATIYADEATGRAAVANGAQFSWISGDTIVRSTRVDASNSTEVARFTTAAWNMRVFGLPYNPRQFGAPRTPVPATMTGSEVTINGSEWTIAAGTSSNAAAAMISYFKWVEDQRFVAHFKVLSGTLSAATLTINAPSGNNTYNLVKTGDVYSIEVSLPASPTAVNLNVVNASASDPLVITEFSVNFSDPDNHGYFRERTAQAIEDFFYNGAVVGEGNVWSLNDTPLSVLAADSSEAQRLTGLAVAPGTRQYVIARVEDSSGDPAIVDRLWMKYNWVAPTPGSHNLFLNRISGKPGWYYGELDPTVLGGTTNYAELTVDNAQTIAAYTQGDVLVTAQIYNDELPTFATSAADAAAGYDSSKLYVEHTSTVSSVYMPAGSATSDKYVQYRHNSFTGPGSATGHIMDQIFAADRTSATAFSPGDQLTAATGQSVAALYDTAVSAFSFGPVHGYCAPNGTSLVFADGVPVDLSTTADYECAEWLRVDFHEIFSNGTATKIGDLVTAYRYVAADQSVYVDVWFEASSAFNAGPLYLSQWNFNSAFFDRAMLPEWGHEVKTTGAQISADYDGTKEVVLYDTAEPYSARMEIIKGDVVSHMVEFSGNSTKPYFSATPAAYSAHANPIPSAQAIANGDVFRMVTKLTILRKE